MIEVLYECGFEVVVEINGIKFVLVGLDWICVSFKVGVDIVFIEGYELKFVYF